MLRRLVFTFMALSCLSAIFFIGKSAYREESSEEEAASPLSTPALPPSSSNEEGSDSESNIFEPSELTESGVYPEYSKLADIENCEGLPFLKDGQIYEFVKNSGLLPSGLFPKIGLIEHFSVFLHNDHDFIQLDLRSDPSQGSNYKIFAYSFKFPEQLENGERLELSPESMVGQPKAEAFDSMQSEIRKFQQQGAVLGARKLSLSTEIPMNGQSRIMRVDLINNRINRLEISQLVLCQRMNGNLKCQCGQASSDTDETE